MANPNPSSNESVSSTVHDAADRFGQQAKSEAQPTMDEVANRINEASRVLNDFFNDASVWFKGNGGRTAAVVAAAAAVGMIGYYIGKSSRPELGDIQDI